MIRILGATLLLAAGTAQAQPVTSATDASGAVAVVADSPAPAAVAQDNVSLEEAVRRVRKQYGGRIVSAETKTSGGRRVHVIKVLTKDGRVRTVRINAN
ncbi:MAG: PepSY domain-containing protein [Pseudomonadota bacterium]